MTRQGFADHGVRSVDVRSQAAARTAAVTRGVGPALFAVLVLAACAASPSTSPGPAGAPSPSVGAAATTVAAATAPPPPPTPAPSLNRAPTPAPSTAAATPAATAAGTQIALAPASIEPDLTIAWQSAGPAPTRACTGNPAIAPDGKLWVMVCWDSKFWIFSPDGKYLESWGEAGSGPGQFNFPWSGGRDAFGGVAFASDGSFYTFDGGNLRVQHFDKNRHFLSSWGGFGTDDGQFVKPTGIGVDGKGQVYIGDGARFDVQVFAPNGTFLRTIAKGWAGPHACDFAYMTVTADGNVFLSSDGVHEYASDGTKLADTNVPAGSPVSSGVAVDAAGHLFVTGGQTCNNIWTYTVELAPDGRVIHAWPATGEQIALGPTAQFLYVTEPDWGFVRAYELP